MKSSLRLLKKQFQLDPKFTYLNHGSFGACPYPIFNEREKWQRELEFQPVSFIDKAAQLLEWSREKLSKYIICDKDDLVYFPNPTTAMNMVIRSLELSENDEVLTTNHEYGAIERTWKFMSSQKGFSYRPINIELPYDEDQFVRLFKEGISPRTKIIFLSHITSPTGIVFPVERICELAKKLGIMVIVDGAHAPAQIDLNIKELGADIYTGACHKWMLCPKGVSFLYASKEIQDKLDPLVVSWGWDSEDPSHSQFLDYHQYQGTNDISAYLSVPSSIKFLNDNDWVSISQYCHKKVVEARQILLETTSTEAICPDAALGQMSSIELKIDDVNSLYKYFKKNNIEVPIINWNGLIFLRISFQCYNTMEDIHLLNKYLIKYLRGI